MNKIGTSQPAPMPWPDDASAQVQQMRRAITAHMHQDPVKSDMAPMMSELLTRLESFVRAERPGDLSGPAAPDPVNPPSPAESGRAIGQVCARLRHEPQNLNADGKHRVEAMLLVLEEHLERKHEVLFRTDFEGK